MENDSTSLHRLIKEKLQHGSQDFVITEELKALFSLLGCQHAKIVVFSQSHILMYTDIQCKCGKNGQAWYRAGHATNIVEVLIPNEPHIPRDNDLGFECMKVWIVGYGCSFLQPGYQYVHSCSVPCTGQILTPKFFCFESTLCNIFLPKRKKIIIRPIYKISDSMETLLSILLQKHPKVYKFGNPNFPLGLMMVLH